MPWTHDSEPVTITRGPLILHLESVFWHLQKYPPRRKAPQRPPLSESGIVREVEQPYRRGHARVFRLPLTRRGVAVGYWEPAGTPITEDEESAALAGAIQSSMIPGITATEISEWARAVDWSWIRLAARWLLSFLPASARGRFLPRLAPRTQTVATRDADVDDGIPDGWSVHEWDDAHPILDLEQARVDRNHVELGSAVDDDYERPAW